MSLEEELRRSLHEAASRAREPFAASYGHAEALQAEIAGLAEVIDAQAHCILLLAREIDRLSAGAGDVS